MTPKEWANLEPGVVLTYDTVHIYRTVSKDQTGRWLVEKLDQFNNPIGIVPLNVDDKRLKRFKVVEDHVASADVQQKLQRTERGKIN